MRQLGCGLLFAALLAASASAAGPFDQPPLKTGSHVGANPAFDREDGETIETAVVIPSLPFSDTGATCDNVDDYDEACPFEGSTSPDVVYSYTPTVDTLVRIDLAGSGYDTKVFVYDERLELVGCNDDAYPDYTSLIDYLELVGGAVYYIVIDGYGGDCGAYALEITAREPCEVICPAGAMLEGEPLPEDGYQDEYNSGCSGPEWSNPFQELPGRDNNTLVFCGMSGWFRSESIYQRETDWFTLHMGPTGVLEVTMSPDLPTYLFHLAPTECANVAVADNVLVGRCETGTMVIEADPGTEIWIWVGPSTFDPPGGVGDDVYDYVLWLDGVAPPDITGVPGGWPNVEASTLTTVKGLFD